MKSWLTGYGHFDDINEIMLINEINININVHKTLTLEYAALYLALKCFHTFLNL